MTPASASSPDGSTPEIMAALFAEMVMQLASTALIFLGRLPHPDSGETVVDVESAKMFIDQLEMLEFKTRGNLGPEETRTIREAIDASKEAFAEALDRQIGDDPPAAAS